MTDKNNTDWQSLFEKYVANTITPEELDRLLGMAEETPEAEALSEALRSYWHKAKTETPQAQIDPDASFHRLMQEAATMEPLPAMNSASIHSSTARKHRIIKMLAAASVLLFLLASGIYLAKRLNEPHLLAVSPAQQAASIQDAAPGYSGAILTLSNGQQIVLDSARNGNLTSQGSSDIIKHNGQLTYKNPRPQTTEVLFNTMSTPKGRQYQLVLADGSKVWLNAASSITYPTTFTGRERKVTITGEAYFEIAKNPAMPFKVMANDAEVAVLGTDFNINAYADEPVIQTTLIEGSVRVSGGKSSHLLEPGQQASLHRNGETNIIRDADLDLALAWKNGFTSFKSADIKTIMRQVERWYDVTVRFNGAVPDRTFTGDISRNANLSQLLRLLEVSKIRFAIEGKILTVTP